MSLTPPLTPMLLEKTQKPFDSKDYLFEYKWDGFRCLLFYSANEIYLQSRKGKNLSAFFPEINNLKNLFHTNKLILDGELCYLQQKASGFALLLKRLKRRENPLMSYPPVTFIVWDILCCDNEIYLKEPLLKRKEFLKNSITEEKDKLYISPFLLYQGNKIYKTARENNMEGIIAKKINSPYRLKRSSDWLKIKIWNYREAIICGYSPDLCSILIGEQDKKSNKLISRGRVKTAFAPEQKDILEKFLPLIQCDSFPSEFSGYDNIMPVKPVLKCKIKYREISAQGKLRHGVAVKILDMNQ